MGAPRIRSTRLAAGFNSAGGTFRVLKLGPASSVILKSFGLTNTAGALNATVVYVVHGSSITVLYRGSLADAADAYWGGWVVLQDNDEIRVQVERASVGWWFSGTLLQGTIDQAVIPIGAQQAPAALDLPHEPAATDAATAT